MLNALRKGAGGFLAKVLIGVLVVAFCLWGINDTFTNWGQGSIGKVGSHKISSEEFSNAYQEQKRVLESRFNKRLTSEEAAALQLPEYTLRQLIERLVYDTHAKELNLGIAPDNLKKIILEAPLFQGIDGKFSMEAFQNYLKKKRMSERQILKDLRSDHVRNQLRVSLVSNVYMPKKMLDAKNIYENEVRKIKYITLPASAVGKIEAPQEADIKAYYDKNPDEFRTPEYRKLSYMLLSANKIKESIKIEDKEIEDVYNNDKSEYVKAEKRDIKQIVFSDMEKAKAAYKKLKDGKKFDDIAKESGQTDKDTDLGSQTKDRIIDKVIAEAAFKLKEGGFSEPIQGQFSLVILMVTKIEPEEVTPLEKAKDKIRDKLALEKAMEKITDLRNAIEDDRRSVALKDIAAKNNMQFAQVTVDQDGKDIAGKAVEGLPASPALMKAVFQSEAGRDNDAVETDETTVVWYEVNETTPSRVKDLKDVKDQAAQKIIETKTRDALNKKASELVEALNKGENFEKLAKDLSVKIESPEGFKRDDNLEKLPKALSGRVFSLANGKFGHSPADDGKARIIFQLIDIKKPEPLDETKRKNMEPRVSNEIANDMLAQYLAGLQNKYGVEVNRAALNQSSRQTTP